MKGDARVSLFDALVKAFPDQSPTLIKACLDGGNILVNGKPTNSKVMVNGEDKVLIVFGGEKQCYAAKNRAEYWAEGVQCWYDTNRTMDHDHNHIHTREQLIGYYWQRLRDKHAAAITLSPATKAADIENRRTDDPQRLPDPDSKAT